MLRTKFQYHRSFIINTENSHIIGTPEILLSLFFSYFILFQERKMTLKIAAIMEQTTTNTLNKRLTLRHHEKHH